MSILGRGARTALLISAAMTMSACATAKVPQVSKIAPDRGSAVAAAVGHEFDLSRPAVRRVRLSGEFFSLRPAGGAMPAAVAQAKVRLDFAGQTPTFDDLLMLLEDRGLSVIIGWDNGADGSDLAPALRVRSKSEGAAGEGQAEAPPPTDQEMPQSTQAAATGEAALNASPDDIRSRRLPFRRYEGTLGGLFRQLQRSMGVTIWWNEGIYVSPVGRYSVMLPQNSDLMGQVVNELRAKGAKNVVASMQAGTVSFVAPGALAEEVIRPYLLRLGRNASEISVQVALVSVTMNQNAARGFDWSKFNLNFGAPPVQNGAGTGNGGGNFPGLPGVPGAPGNGSGTTTGLPEGGLFSFGQDALRIFNPALNIFGSTRPLDITGAIKFLSTYGNTNVDQNVELRTLSGTAVSWRSGETIPYVAGVSATAASNFGGSGGLAGGLLGSAQTEKLETGLTLKLSPNYEANGGLVTVDFNLELVELIEFVELKAGDQLGSFTQPRTREQKLDDIVRVPVGETVVLGGLRRQVSSATRNGPFGLYGIGSKNKMDETQTVFIILRPTVTVYEVAGLEQPIPTRSNDTSVGTDGAPWLPAAGEYRGTNLFGTTVEAPGPERRRSMAQPEKSYD